MPYAALLVLFLMTTQALGNDWHFPTAAEVDESICEQCRQSSAKNIPQCFRCHFCDTDEVTVKWSNLAGEYQSLALQEAKNPIVAVEAAYPNEARALAAFIPGIPQRSKPKSNQTLSNVKLSASDVKGNFQKALVLDYSRLNFSVADSNSAKELNRFEVTVFACDDTNNNGSCSDEDQRYQVIPKTAPMRVCTLPRIIVMKPIK